MLLVQESDSSYPKQGVLQVSVWDEQAEPINDAIQKFKNIETHLVHLRNLRGKLDGNGLLAGAINVDDVRGKKDITFLTSSNPNYQPQIQALMA